MLVWRLRITNDDQGLMSRSWSLLLLLVLAASVKGFSVLALQKPDIKSNLPENRKVELGRTLFFDKRLSEDGTLNLAGCCMKFYELIWLRFCAFCGCSLASDEHDRHLVAINLLPLW